MAVIIVVIGAIAVRTSSSARAEGNTRLATTTARGLGEAIEQFQRDHGGRLPDAPGTSDWTPDGAEQGSIRAWQSPVDETNGNRPYANAGSMEALADGRIALRRSNGTSAPGTGDASATIRYVTDPANGQYALDVEVRKRGSMQPACYVSNATNGSLITGLAAERPC